MTDHYYSRKQIVQSNPSYVSTRLKDHNFKFKTDAGVFSKSQIDFGSKLLVENFVAPNLTGPILDVGCGYGPIGLTVAKMNPETTVHLVDINERALGLAKENAEINNIKNINVYESDCLSNVTETNFKAVITNPPIRAGKEIIFDIFNGAEKVLQKNGELWIVIQKKQGAQSTIKYLQSLFSHVEIVEKKKGYFIIKAKKV